MPTIERDAIAPHVVAIANYLDYERKDFMDEPDGLRRENHIWQRVAALLAVIGKLTPAEEVEIKIAPTPELLEACRRVLGDHSPAAVLAAYRNNEVWNKIMRAHQKIIDNEQIRQLETEIRVNEALPAGMRCDNAIRRMKSELARLKRGPDLKLVKTAEV